MTFKTTEDELRLMLANAMIEYPIIREVFSMKKAEVDRFLKLCMLLYNNELLNHVSEMTKLSYGISEEVFVNYYSRLEMLHLIIGAIRDYAETHPTNQPMGIDAFMLSHSGHSPCLVYMKKIVEGNELKSLSESITPVCKEYLTKINSFGHKAFTGWIEFIKWYRINKSALQMLNRGAWEISPFKSESQAVGYYLKYMVDNKLNVCYINSHQWFEFLNQLQEDYSIGFEGEDIGEVTYDANYDHSKPVMKPMYTPPKQ